MVPDLSISEKLVEQKLRADAKGMLQKITDLIICAKPINDTLFSGELAIAFYFSYLYELTGEQEHADIAISKLEGVLNAFNEDNVRLFDAHYCNGLSGLLFIVILFINKGLIDPEIKNDTDLLEEKLVQSILTSIEQDNNDILLGSFGSLNVLVDCAILKKNNTHINTILRYIEKRYMLQNNPWIVSTIVGEPDLININFSMSHGQTGLLQILLKAYTVAGRNLTTDHFLKRNIDYILSFYSETAIKNTFNHFPSFFNSENSIIKASKRLAWCYGDFGQVLLLYRAAIFFEDETYFNLAEKVGYKTTLRKTFETTSLNMSQLCHGTGGVAQMYQTLGSFNKNMLYNNSYFYWIRQTVDYLNAELLKEITPISTTNILEGFPGAGLALMSYLSPNYLDYSKIIFL